ncbi:3-deoxy-manno-octulosonate cytidylyltransferase [Aliikangiella sp. IMCC44359]|uniref:3-deoxy-manno-octulosonate cytidylyltransferase n=1 Tax=Aliikangiella sp. IMCC44359 TaxID=3459125 RepID=UPI00403AC643
MIEFHVIIPARYHSTRLAAKALATIGNKTMIEHVCYQAAQSGAQSITVATDDERIKTVVDAAGYSAVLTSEKHPSGSDRVYQAAEIVGLDEKDIIVNVQGDEPFIPPENIVLVASLLSKTDYPMATLCCQIESAEEVLDPNAVKVVFDKTARALYFSRSAIPFSRHHQIKLGQPLQADYFRHIGIYAYRKAFLKQFIHWSPSEHEQTESLEQLRVLDNGQNIAIACLDEIPPHGVDTQTDLDKARKHYNHLT